MRAVAIRVHARIVIAADQFRSAPLKGRVAVSCGGVGVRQEVNLLPSGIGDSQISQRIRPVGAILADRRTIE